MKEVTCLIPMYATAKHLHLVIDNIDRHIARGARVLLSDRHLLDDAAARLADRYRAESLVTVFTTDDGDGGWVRNVNFLLQQVETPFFRIIPHDDSVPATSTEFLLESLQQQNDAVLCHGRVLAEDMDGERLPTRDEPNHPLFPPGIEAGSSSFALQLFWNGLFNGAFKALVRTETVHRNKLLIRPTPNLIHSERAWLFALALVGEFMFDERAWMTKRYWQGSLTDSWAPGGAEAVNAALVMASFADDLIPDQDERARVRFNLCLNALRRAHWLDAATATFPSYCGLRTFPSSTASS